MKTLRSRRPSARSRAGRAGLDFDRLEARLALSSTAGAVAPSPVLSDSLSVLSVDPATGSNLTRAPGALTVTFDRPLAALPSSSDFRLDRVEADGSEAPVSTAGILLQESIDGTGTEDLITTSAPLATGRYRLYLLGTANLNGSDGSTLAGGGDQLIDDFTIAAPGPDLGSATDLGSPIGAVATVPGSLDLASDPGAVAYYRVELPAGHFWRLGAEVDAGRIGSPLFTSLTVLDAQGRPIATSTTGRPDYPNDPFEFLGLGPGTYYIAVSGRSGLVDGAGASSGAFRLQVVADPADNPTAVEAFSLDFADPTSRVPTGLTIQFAGPMSEAAMNGHASDLIQLVDASGRAWQVDAQSYNESESNLTLVFDQALPAGRYSVQLAGQGDLVDLAGRAPVAPGFPAGALGQIVIPGGAPARNPNDYGPVFPKDAEGGVSAVVHLAPGQKVAYRFVITAGSTYDLETTFGGDEPTLVAHVGGKAVPLVAGSAGVVQDHRVTLPPGVVTLDVVGGPHGSTIDWSFLLAATGSDLLLDNGVGQASALGLRLIAPSPLDPQAAPAAIEAIAAAPAPGPATPGPAPSSAAPGPTAGPSGPGGLFIAAGAGLIGHPSTQDEAVAVVGPVAPGGMTALSTTVAGIPQGLSVGFGGRGRAGRGPDNSGAVHALLDVPEPEGTAVTSVDPVVGGPVADLPPLPDAPADPAAAVAEVAQGPGLIDRASSLLAGLFRTRRRPSGRPDPAALDDAALADLGRDSRQDGEESVEAADMSSPLGLGLIVVAAAHSHKRLGRWLGRCKTRIVARRQGAIPRGPRRPTT